MSDENKADTAKTERPKLFSMSQLLGGALAAATIAALGSRIGVGGTVVGAAVGSLVAAVVTGVYTACLAKTGQGVKKLIKRNGTAAGGAPVAVAAAPRRSRGPWMAILTGALSAVGIFAVAMVLITGAEVTTGTSLDGKKGTTVGSVVKNPTPSPSVTVSTPTATPTTPVPSPVSSPVTTTPVPTPITPTATPTAVSPEPTTTTTPASIS